MKISGGHSYISRSKSISQRNLLTRVERVKYTITEDINVVSYADKLKRKKRHNININFFIHFFPILRNHIVCMKQHQLHSFQLRHILYKLISPVFFVHLIISNRKWRIILFRDSHWKLIMASCIKVINKLRCDANNLHLLMWGNY